MLILLDIDGVMVPATSWRRPQFLSDGFSAFSSKSVEALQRIIFETDAGIILTTSHKSTYDIDKWREIFKSRGLDVNRIDRLPNNYLNSSRKDEILSWHEAAHDPNESFVIIDDDKSLNDLPNHLKMNLILTSPLVGLTDELADNAISILNQGLYTYA